MAKKNVLDAQVSHLQIHAHTYMHPLFSNKIIYNIKNTGRFLINYNHKISTSNNGSNKICLFVSFSSFRISVFFFFAFYLFKFFFFIHKTQ